MFKKMTDRFSEKKEKSSSDDGNDLLLYHYYGSSFSQKVVFALFEKKLKFKSHIIDLFAGDQFSPFFMQLNPKGEVPVLVDGVKVIPDSSRIIDYLEDNFSNGDTPRLKAEKGTPQYQLMEKFNGLLDKINIPVITFGSLMNPNLAEKMNMPPLEIKNRMSIFENGMAKISEFSQKHPELKEQYDYKREKFTALHSSVTDVDNVKKTFADLDSVLDEIEKELSSRDGEKEKWWICGEKFTITDITLAVIINRLNDIGLWNHYFGDAKHPKLNLYFKRLQKRDAFKRTMNQNSGILKSLQTAMDDKVGFAITVTGLMIVLGVCVGTAVTVKRLLR